MPVRCFGCMRTKESSPVCEHCGFDERSRNNTHQLPAGTVLGGQYIVGRVLGQGGFGITYIGWDNVMNQRVAVKEYFPSGYAGRDTRNTTDVTSYDTRNAHAFEENKRRFLREAESLAKLWNVPQIVRVLRHFEENGTAYIAMEYAEGTDLRKYLKQLGRPMTLEELLRILGPIMEALSQVHKAELVHRDISPDNIMVLPDGSGKLLDFGAARFVENANAEADRNTSTQAILKHGFAPPEQYRSRGALGPWTDIYAMCATVYFCLTGRIPPESMSRMMGEADLNLENLPGLTQQQKAALASGMALMPNDRIKTAEELHQQLFGEILATREAAKRQNKPRSSKTRIMLLAVTAAALLAAVPVIRGLLPQENVPQMQEPTADWPTADIETVDTAVPEETTLYLETEAVIPLEIQSAMYFYPAELGSRHKIEIASGHSAGELQWSSSNPEVATVSENGFVTLLQYGMTEITVQYQDQTVSCKVIANPDGNLDCTYEFCTGGVMITGYNGAVPEDLILPAQIDGKPVKAIASYVFENNTKITSVYIPYGVESIGWDAFRTCTKLTQVNIPESVTDIGPSAFQSTPWIRNYPGDFVICGDSILIDYKGTATDLTIPENVKTVGDAFHRSGTVRNVVIPDTVTRIATYAFRRCSSLVSVSIPGSVQEIESAAFEDCTNLRDVIIAEGVVTIGNRAFYGCTALKEIVLPSTVREIVNSAFSNCGGLTSIVIPEGVEEIDAYVFKNCNKLSSVTVPRSVEYVGLQAFFNCYSLREISLPSGCRVDGTAFSTNCTINYY